MLWFRRLLAAVIVILLILIIIGWPKALYEPHKKFVKIYTNVYENVVKYFPFTAESSLKEWEEKILKGRTVYRIEEDINKYHYVQATSNGTASALYYKIKLDPKKHPILSWKWRVVEFPKRTMPEKIESKAEEDYAARIYVVFPAPFFPNSKSLVYIWAQEMPVGTTGNSPYSKNIKVMVLKSGNAGEWAEEKRDVYEDYVKLFGEAPKMDIGAISFMTNSDNTKTQAVSSYSEIKVVYKNDVKN